MVILMTTVDSEVNSDFFLTIKLFKPWKDRRIFCKIQQINYIKLSFMFLLYFKEEIIQTQLEVYDTLQLAFGEGRKKSHFG